MFEISIFLNTLKTSILAEKPRWKVNSWNDRKLQNYKDCMVRLLTAVSKVKMTTFIVFRIDLLKVLLHSKVYFFLVPSVGFLSSTVQNDVCAVCFHSFICWWVVSLCSTNPGLRRVIKSMVGDIIASWEADGVG